MYNVEKYIIYLFALWKQIEKQAPGGQMKFISIHIQCKYIVIILQYHKVHNNCQISLISEAQRASFKLFSRVFSFSRSIVIG
jgi:hypothetical protein